MLRAAKSIKINSGFFQNNDGMLVSPELNIHGLVINASQPVPEKIKDFLNSKGATIRRVKIENELLLWLNGDFLITQESVKKFLSDNPEFTHPNDNLSPPSLPNFKRTITQEMKTLSAKSNSIILENETKWIEMQVPTIHTTDATTIESGNSATLAGSTILLGKNIEISSGKTINIDGIDTDAFKTKTSLDLQGASEKNGPSVGVMSELYSGKKGILFASKNINVKNTSINSRDEVSISTEQHGGIILEMDTTTHWLNNPYPEVYEPMLENGPSSIEITRRNGGGENVIELSDDEQEKKSTPFSRMFNRRF